MSGARKPARRSKYGNVKTVVDGITFDSKAEAARYGELKVRVRKGEICDLERQPKFRLLVAGKKVGSIKGDFRYYEAGVGVVEDVKGATPRDFTLRWKLARALYPHLDWRLIPAKSVRVSR